MIPMKTNPESENLDPQDAQLLRYMDGLEQDPHPEWLAEKTSAEHLGELLRGHLPPVIEPPSAEFFTSQIMAQITPSRTLKPQREAQSLFQSFRHWFAPLTTAAAVLVVGGILLKRESSTGIRPFAYTPIANVTATLAFNEAAGATVIDLNGLQAIPDSREIKAFNVASGTAFAPGTPQRYYAANDPAKLLFVLFPSDQGEPSLHESHE